MAAISLSKRITMERSVWAFLSISAGATVFSLLLICLFLLRESAMLFRTYSFIEFLTGEIWLPTSSPALFGLMPLLAGSFLVTAGSMILAVPVGIACAIYLSELAPSAAVVWMKSFIEILSGVPSVVFGFFGLVVLVPATQEIFNLSTGQTALTGAVILSFMTLPIIISLSSDAICTVPLSLREGSLALGATHWQTVCRVVIPAALSGISAAVILGVGRAIGETMSVMMVTGNTAHVPNFLTGFFGPVRTMTATIALEMGEVPGGSDHYYALFAIGAVLFFTTFGINFAADKLRRKYRLRA